MSTQRAFVIQFLQRPNDPEGFTGRVEHVATGETAHFASEDDLLGFLHRLNGRQTTSDAPRADAAVAGAAPHATRERDPEREPAPPPRAPRRRGRAS